MFVMTSLSSLACASLDSFYIFASCSRVSIFSASFSASMSFSMVLLTAISLHFENLSYLSYRSVAGTADF